MGSQLLKKQSKNSLLLGLMFPLDKISHQQKVIFIINLNFSDNPDNSKQPPVDDEASST